MWKPINDCNKQLTIHSRIREKTGESFLIYEVIEVEFDQYKLQLVDRDDKPVEEEIHNVLNCEQISQYHFEVEEKVLVQD